MGYTVSYTVQRDNDNKEMKKKVQYTIPKNVVCGIKWEEQNVRALSCRVEITINYCGGWQSL